MILYFKVRLQSKRQHARSIVKENFPEKLSDSMSAALYNGCELLDTMSVALYKKTFIVLDAERNVK